jgi:hypothetical protein
MNIVIRRTLLSDIMEIPHSTMEATHVAQVVHLALEMLFSLDEMPADETDLLASSSALAARCEPGKSPIQAAYEMLRAGLVSDPQAAVALARVALEGE